MLHNLVKKVFHTLLCKTGVGLEYKLWPQIQGERKGVEGIRYRGVFGTISTMIRTEGPKSLYNGLVAGLQRQVCFASIRIGLYDNVKDFYTGGKDSKWLLSGRDIFSQLVSFIYRAPNHKNSFQREKKPQNRNLTKSNSGELPYPGLTDVQLLLCSQYTQK